MLQACDLDQNAAPTDDVSQHSDLKEKGLSLVLKIILLSILPIILMGGLNFYTKNASDRAFETISNQKAQQLKEEVAIFETKDGAERAALSMIQAINSTAQNHQKGLLGRNAGSVASTQKLFGDIHPKYEEFNKQIELFVEAVDVSAFLKLSDDQSSHADAQSERVLSKKRLAFLLRSSSALKNLISSYQKSNAGSLQLLKGSNFDGAINNYVFEEASRITALENRLHKIVTQLDLVSEELNSYIKEQSHILDQESDAKLGFISTLNIAVLAITSIILLGLVLLFVRLQVATPLKNITGAMRNLSGGDLQTVIPKANQDEIGEMARALQVFKDNLIETQSLQETQEAQQKIELDKAKKLGDIVNSFEGQATQAVAMFSSSSEDMLGAAQQLSNSVSSSQATSDNVRDASNTAMQNVEAVAESVSQMSEAVQEIASQITKTQNIVSDSVDKTQNADEKTAMLSEATDKIGEIVTLIQDIAEQTNLLALNATIEAARAGDAGKGFAVVANEVKSLASQTAQATEEISASILEVQNISESVIESISAIRESIEQVNHSSSTVASAVEEQSSVMGSISSSMHNASQSVQEITQNISEVSGAIDQVRTVAESVSASSNALSEQAQALDDEIKTFCSDVNAV